MPWAEVKILTHHIQSSGFSLEQFNVEMAAKFSLYFLIKWIKRICFYNMKTVSLDLIFGQTFKQSTVLS